MVFILLLSYIITINETVFDSAFKMLWKTIVYANDDILTILHFISRERDRKERKASLNKY